MKEVGIRNKAHLMSVIQQKWQEINADKVLCKQLIMSLPKRLQAVKMQMADRSQEKIMTDMSMT